MVQDPFWEGVIATPLDLGEVLTWESKGTMEFRVELDSRGKESSEKILALTLVLESSVRETTRGEHTTCGLWGLELCLPITNFRGAVFPAAAS